MPELEGATPGMTLEWDVPEMAPTSMRILDSRITRRPQEYPLPRGWDPTLDDTIKTLAAEGWLPMDKGGLGREHVFVPLSQGRNVFRTGEPSVMFGVHYGRVHPTPCNPDVPGYTMSHEAWISVAQWCRDPCCSGGALAKPDGPLQFVDGILINTLGVSYPSATGHFVVQSLPRLLRSYASVPSLLRHHVKILMAPHSRVVTVMLDRLYDLDILTPDQVLVSEGNTVFAAPLVLFTDGATHMGDNVELVSRVLKYGLEPDDPSLVVFLRRVHSRVLTNHQDVYDTLSSAFPSEKIVDFRPEDVDFYQMVDILRQATIFMAPHGAGHYHMLFAPPCTPVLEFGIYAQMYYHLAVNTARPYWIISSMNPSLEEVVAVVNDMFAWRSSPAYQQCLKDHFATWATSLQATWAALGPSLLSATKSSVLRPALPPPALQRVLDGHLPSMPQISTS